MKGTKTRRIKDRMQVTRTEDVRAGRKGRNSGGALGKKDINTNKRKNT